MNEKGHPEYATILAFDVDVTREAQEQAQEMNVRIMTVTADIMCHLFDQVTSFTDELNARRREEAAAQLQKMLLVSIEHKVAHRFIAYYMHSIAMFRSIRKVLPHHVFNQKDPNYRRRRSRGRYFEDRNTTLCTSAWRSACWKGHLRREQRS